MEWSTACNPLTCGIPYERLPPIARPRHARASQESRLHSLGARRADAGDWSEHRYLQRREHGLVEAASFPRFGFHRHCLSRAARRRISGLKRFAVSAANYLDWRKQNDVFESISIYGGRTLRLGGGSRPQSVLTTISDADFFTVLGARLAIGRAFTEAECEPGRDAVIVLSHGFAESQFGSPNALGRQLVLNGRNYQVIGSVRQYRRSRHKLQ
jgi:hypothetical protein